MTGLYFFKEAGYVHDYVPFGGGLFIYDIANDVDTKSYAAFVHADYKLTDKWGLTLGARYSKDDKKFEGGQADLTGYSYKTAPGCFTASGPDMACWAAFAPTVGLAPLPGSDQPVPLLPAGRAEPEVQHLHADGRHSVPCDQGPDVLRQLLQRLQSGRLDHAIV